MTAIIVALTPNPMRNPTAERIREGGKRGRRKKTMEAATIPQSPK
jgi:hypothetical protein